MRRWLWWAVVTGGFLQTVQVSALWWTQLQQQMLVLQPLLLPKGSRTDPPAWGHGENSPNGLNPTALSDLVRIQFGGTELGLLLGCFSWQGTFRASCLGCA